MISIDKKIHLAETWARDYSWNLMTQMSEYLERPLIIERGLGCWLYDIYGTRYFDGNASMWKCVHGHNHPELNEALVAQMQRLADTTYVCRSNLPVVKLSQKLASIGPEGLTRSFFTNNGSTAIESALKMSFQYWQMAGKDRKRKVISMAGGHHGLSFGAMAVGGNKAMHLRFRPWAFECEMFKSPECSEYAGVTYYQDDTQSIEDLKRLLEKMGEEIACVVLESSIQSVAGTGMKLQPKGFLKKVKALCEAYNVHLALDEIFVGFGRSGPMFACKEEGVMPDFLCLGKGITSAYMPMGVTLTHESIYEAFLGDAMEGKTFMHGHTYGGNALASAVAYQSITMLEADMHSGNHFKRIEIFGQTTKKYFENHPYVRNIRQRGFMCAIDLYPGIKSQSFKSEERVGYRVGQHALDKGLIIRAYGDALFLIPPFVANEEEIEFLCRTTSESIIEYISNYLKK